MAYIKLPKWLVLNIKIDWIFINGEKYCIIAELSVHKYKNGYIRRFQKPVKLEMYEVKIFITW